MSNFQSLVRGTPYGVETLEFSPARGNSTAGVVPSRSSPEMEAYSYVLLCCVQQYDIRLGQYHFSSNDLR